MPPAVRSPHRRSQQTEEPVGSTTPEPTIAAGVATFTGQGGMERTRLAEALEEAMSQAVLQALEDGFSIEDSPSIIAYKQHARAVVLREYGREDVEIPELPARVEETK